MHYIWCCSELIFRTMKIYEFRYNPMTEESATMTVSLHMTKEGAEKAMTEHKEQCRKEWEINADRQRKQYGMPLTKFGQWEFWSVGEVEVLP